MGNWFNKISQEQESMSRWHFTVDVDVFVPRDVEEENNAKDVLTLALRKVNGDASAYSGVLGSSIRFEPLTNPLKI